MRATCTRTLSPHSTAGGSLCQTKGLPSSAQGQEGTPGTEAEGRGGQIRGSSRQGSGGAWGVGWERKPAEVARRPRSHGAHGGRTTKERKEGGSWGAKKGQAGGRAGCGVPSPGRPAGCPGPVLHGNAGGGLQRGPCGGPMHGGGPQKCRPGQVTGGNKMGAQEGSREAGRGAGRSAYTRT